MLFTAAVPHFWTVAHWAGSMHGRMRAVPELMARVKRMVPRNCSMRTADAYFPACPACQVKRVVFNSRLKLAVSSRRTSVCWCDLLRSLLSFQKYSVWLCWCMYRLQFNTVLNSSTSALQVCSVLCLSHCGRRASSTACCWLLAASFCSEILEAMHVVPSIVLQLKTVSGLDFSEYNWF